MNASPAGAPRSARRFGQSRGAWWILLLLVAFVVLRYYTVPPEPPSAPPLADGPVEIAYVVDGDTLELAGGRRVRLIGVDTPETVKRDHPVEPFGPEATRFTRDFVADGGARIALDRERQDRYGRTLAYVWVGDRMLNEELVRAGLARFEPQYHYDSAIKRRLRAAQEEAQRAGRGIWSQPSTPSPGEGADRDGAAGPTQRAGPLLKSAILYSRGKIRL